MGFRLTGISTPIGGISWDYGEAEQGKLKEVVLTELKPNMKLKVFISSICGNPKYDEIRKLLKERIEHTQLADVYACEQEEATTLPDGANDTYALRDSDVCIFLIDNKDGITQNVQRAIDIARRERIESLYYFCDENSKEITAVEQSIMGVQFAKSRTVHHFADLAEHSAQALINDIIKIYHNYCLRRIVPIIEDIDTVQNVSVDGIEYIQMPTIPRAILKNVDKCKEYILRFILDAPYLFFDGKTNELDDWGCQFLPVLFERRSIKQFNTALFLQEIKKHQSDEYYRVVEIRWQAIQAYYGGNLNECLQKIREALQFAKETKQPNWVINDILIDLRNHELQLGHIKNRRLESDAQKELSRNEEEIYYPVLDRINESLQEKYMVDLLKERTKSPYSVTISNELSQYGGMIASSYIVSLYNGSLTHIRKIHDKIKSFSFFLSNKYDDWVLRRNLLMYEVYNGKESEVANILNSYPEILNNMTSEEALKILEFCDNHPLEHNKVISQLVAFGAVGYYLDENKFNYYCNRLISKIKDWLEDETPTYAIGDHVFSNLEKVSYRISQNELANLCCLFIDKEYKRWYTQMFRFIAQSIQMETMDEQSRSKFIEHLISMFEKPEDLRQIQDAPGFLHRLRKQDKVATNELDAKVREHLQSYYEETYKLETSENGTIDMPLFIRKYVARVKKSNETQGVNGQYFDYATRDIATIRAILIYDKYDYENELMDSVIHTIAETLLYAKEGALAKLDAASLLVCIVLSYPSDYERNKDVFAELYNKRDCIKIEDISMLSSNIDELALRVALNLLFSILGYDVSRELMEDMSYLQDNKATTISVIQAIADYIEASDNVVFPVDIQRIILQNTFQWIHSKNTNVRWNTTRILLGLLRTSENESIINHQLIHLVDTESFYVKNLILRNIFKCKNINEATRQYILSKCETDPCYIVRLVCEDEKRKAKESC